MDRRRKRKQEVPFAISDRQASGLRFYLAVSAFLAIYIDPSEPDRFVPLTYAALLFYVFYSACIYLASRRVDAFSRATRSALVCMDLLLCSVLVSLSSGTNSVFFFFYFFVIVQACSRLGANAGVAVTLAATVIFFSLGYFGVSGGVHEWNRLLIRPVSLVGLGYVLTYWARAEHRLRGKLELLREVSSSANPRFGGDRTAGRFMERILEFFKAESCVMLEQDRGSGEYQLRIATAGEPEEGIELYTAPESIRVALQRIGETGGAVLYSEQAHWWRPAPVCLVRYPEAQSPSHLSVEDAVPVAEWLSSRSFIAVPLRDHEWIRGYLFVGSQRRAAFRLDDAGFLLQAADQFTPVLEHIHLVDSLASESAADERRRIARSVHDRVIQPYLGLQVGLKGVHGKLRSAVKAGDTVTRVRETQEAMTSLEHLVEMARDGVWELREYVDGLRKTEVCQDVLLNALLRHAARFESVTGIRVSVVDRCECADLNDRLAGEIFQMATEALSNVHRHTTATAVSLTIERGPEGNIFVRIENEAAEQPKVFLPRSIAERSESLGGRTRVSHDGGLTVVQIEIPL